MSVKQVLTVLASLGIVCLPASVQALPLITSITENGTNVPTAPGAIVTSAGSPSPSGLSAAIVDEAFIFTDRSHEFTVPRTDVNGNLTTNAAGALRLFPYYLNGAEYINFANADRAVVDYRLDADLAAPVAAFLMIDNRADGSVPATPKVNSSDPILTGPLSWVVSDGWTRVNTGQMPNGQFDYVGCDDGPTTALTDENQRAHHDTGSGVALDNFFAIYMKLFPAGNHIGFTKQYLGTANTLMYSVAVVPPGSLGDVNGDNVTNVADYQVIRDHFNQTSATRTDGDLNGDTVVDFTDFRIWKNFRAIVGSGAGGGFAMSVPEPGSLVLLLMGVFSAAASLIRRR